jgi:hypothetical protein
VDVIGSVPPSLTINYTYGKPGSIFTLTGWNFIPGAKETLSLNGQVITTTLAINETGSFVFFLDTSGAGPGGYTVTVSGNPGAASGFCLFGDAPLRPQEGGGQTFKVPIGAAPYACSIYLPVVKR